MGLYQTIQLGRVTLREDLDVNEKFDGSVTLTGQESMPNVSKLDIERRREDLLGMRDELLPVRFTEKSNLDGFYRVSDVDTTMTNWDGLIAVMPWQVTLQRIGRSTALDIESRLSGSATRVNDFSATGQRWHAPAVNALAYWAGNTAPIYASRTGSEGLLKVYQNIGATVNPRWGSAIADYPKGRVRFIDQNGFERHGTDIETSGTNWELNNSLLRIRPLNASGSLEFSAWTGSAWASKSWDVLFGTSPVVSLGFAEYVSVIWNTFECVVVRLVKSVGTVGRITVDITLRRGAAFAELYVQHEFGTTLKIVRASAEAGTGGTGYVSATSADSNGFKYFAGSAKSFTGDNVNGGLSKTSTATLDAAVGICFDATAGNTAADLYTQYLGSPAEYVQGVKR